MARKTATNILETLSENKEFAATLRLQIDPLQQDISGIRAENRHAVGEIKFSDGTIKLFDSNFGEQHFNKDEAQLAVKSAAHMIHSIVVHSWIYVRIYWHYIIPSLIQVCWILLPGAREVEIPLPHLKKSKISGFSAQRCHPP